MRVSIPIFFFATLSFSLGENLIPPILTSKVKSCMTLGSAKMWMKFLEKELEVRSLQTIVQKSSLLVFYKNNFKNNIFKQLPTSCQQMNLKKIDGIQTTIYDKICGSSKEGRKPKDVEGKSIGISFVKIT